MTDQTARELLAAANPAEQTALVERLRAALDPFRRAWAVAFSPFDKGVGQGTEFSGEEDGVGPRLPTAWPTIGDLRRLAVVAEALSASSVPPTAARSAALAERRAEPFLLNVNVAVQIKLTEDGRRFHRERHAERYSMLAYMPPREDEDGWSKWQLWSLMSEFGDAIYMGGKVPFETTIKVVPDQVTAPQPLPPAPSSEEVA